MKPSQIESPLYTHLLIIAEEELHLPCSNVQTLQCLETTNNFNLLQATRESLILRSQDNRQTLKFTFLLLLHN